MQRRAARGPERRTARVTAVNCILQHEITLLHYYKKKKKYKINNIGNGILPIDNLLRELVRPIGSTFVTILYYIINNRSLNRAFPGPRKHIIILYYVIRACQFFFLFLALSYYVLYFEPGIGNPDARAYVDM